MIAYDYRCECGREWEARRPMDHRVMACPRCGAECSPRITSPPALSSKRKTEGK